MNWVIVEYCDPHVSDFHPAVSPQKHWCVNGRQFLLGTSHTVPQVIYVRVSSPHSQIRAMSESIRVGATSLSRLLDRSIASQLGFLNSSGVCRGALGEPSHIAAYLYNPRTLGKRASCLIGPVGIEN